MGLGIYQTFRELENFSVEFKPCPFCGGMPEWVTVGGWDYIMRCISCHASTENACGGPEEAAYEWNAGKIVDDNYSITCDTKIDEYLSSGIKKILFKEYSNFEEFPETEDGFMCSSVIIVTEDMILSLEDDFKYIHYIELCGYGESILTHPIAPDGCSISFLESSWENDRLVSLSLKCDDNILTITSLADEECLHVKYSK